MEKNIIVLSGKARAGKDTLGKFLAKALYEKTHRVHYLHAYATQLKREIQEKFDLSYDQLWGDLKESPDKRYHKSTEDGTKIEGSFWTPREMMQEYGQFYRRLSSGYWVSSLFGLIEYKEHKDVIITDGRHRNEIVPIVELGGIHIRIDRPDVDGVMKIHGMEHISETAAFSEEIPVDIVVKNSRDLDFLEKTAYSVVDQIITLRKLKGDVSNG